MSAGDDLADESIGRLFGNGVQHWLDHQKPFWLVAGSYALLCAAIQWLGDYGVTNRLSGAGGMIAGLYIVMLSFWLNIILDPDWSKRSKLLAAQKKKARKGILPGRLIGFCIVFALFVLVVTSFVTIRIFDRLPTKGIGSETAILLLGVIVEPPILLLATGLSASFLLYLPAQVVDYKLSLGQAFTLVSGLRLRLTGFALLCCLLALISTLVMIAGAFVRLPDARWIGGALRMLAVSFDSLALYIAAYGMSRLFVLKTGWRPAPLDSVGR
jgi:hypothetical protein